MPKNELLINEPRIGWYYDGMPDDVTPPTATMLRDDGRLITLTLPWRSEVPTSQVERWFHGNGSMFADDPGRTRYSYSVPPQLLFNDVFGTVVLVGCRAAGFRSKWGGGALGHGTVSVRIAVFDGRSLQYDRINGLRTVIPELASWTGLTSIKESIEYGDDKKVRRVDVTLDSPESIRLASKLNIRISPNWRVDHAANDGPRQLHDEAFIETRNKHPRSWEDHFAAHQTVRDLLDISAWRPFGYRRITANRTDDPVRVLSGDAISEKWCQIRTYAVRSAQPIDRRPSYLFTFTDIGPRGYRRWVTTRSRYERGIVPLIGLLDVESSNVETQLTQSSIGLEAIGYQLALDAGMSERKASTLPLVSRLQIIESTLPVDVVTAGWPTRAANVYNGLKHANRALPDPASMLNTVRENITVFRIWAASKIGVDQNTLASNLRVDSIVQSLRQQNLAHEPKVKDSH